MQKKFEATRPRCTRPRPLPNEAEANHCEAEAT